MAILKHLGLDGKTLESISEAQTEKKTLQRAIDRADSVFAEFENKVEGVSLTPEQIKAELRRPEKLYLRISDRLVENGITPRKWKKGWPEHRDEMMDKAFQIMLEEMQVPEEIRRSAHLCHARISVRETVDLEFIRSRDSFHSQVRNKWDRSRYGDSGRFVFAAWDDERMKAFHDGNLEKAKLDLNKTYGGLYKMEITAPPGVVTLPLDHCLEEDLEKGLQPVMLHALMIMEQASLLEPEGTIWNAKLQDSWRKQVVNESLGFENSVDSIFETAETMSRDFFKTYERVNRAKKFEKRIYRRPGK